MNMAREKSDFLFFNLGLHLSVLTVNDKITTQLQRFTHVEKTPYML